MPKLRSLKIFLVILLALLACLLLWPIPDSLDVEADHSLKILDRNGKLLYEVRDDSPGSKEYIALSDIPPQLTDTLLAVEDRGFYGHMGFSPRAILRAAWQNFQAGEIVSGGSTITQQLVRIRLQPKERNYAYKLREIFYAFRLDLKLSKDEILESYLNSVYFGHQAYGLQAAARTFFDKNAMELSLAESTLLIGLIQSPSSYDPFVNFERAKARQKTVLNALAQNPDYSDLDKEALLNQKIKLSNGKISIRAPHFVMWLLDEWKNQMQPNEKNEVYTTLDLDLQSEIELIIENHLRDLEDRNVSSAAIVVLDTKTGEILAMIGSADYFDFEKDGSYNVALADRQPGSALKPFTYALALQKGGTLASTVADIETQFFTQEGNPYVPRNYDYGYHGLVRYREALANSYNISAVKVLEKVGVQELLNFLKELGLSTLSKSAEHYGLALTLGDAEVKLLELTQGYGMLGRGGTKLNVSPLQSFTAPAGARVLDEKIAWLITNTLDDDEARLQQFGDNGPLEFDFPVAAKTGTTRNSRDNWTLGYTPEVAVGVWVGNADNSPMRNTSGITGAGPIFHEAMIAATRYRPKTGFPRPEGLLTVEICMLSGLLPTPYCPHTMREWFIQGTEPIKKDDIFQNLTFDTRNGLPAGEGCPDEFTEEKVIAVFPPDLGTWARENGWPESPTGYSPLCPRTEEEEKTHWLNIEKPNQNESFLLDPLIPNENEKVIFQASANPDIQEVEWYVNGSLVGTGKAPSFRLEWLPEAGEYTIEARAENLSDQKIIQVLR